MKRRFQVIITLALVASTPLLMGAEGCQKQNPNQPSEVTMSVYGGEANQSFAVITYQQADGRYVQLDRQKLPWSITVQRKSRTAVTASALSGRADTIECVAERSTGGKDRDEAKFVIGEQVTCSV